MIFLDMEQDKTSIYDLEFLEIMLINACNLSCQGCTTFSDVRHSGYVSWSQGRSWLEPWTKRMNILGVGVMGGEPLMNPDLRSWLVGIRKLLPAAQIRFVTNATLLERNWWVLDLLEDLGNAVFKISAHTTVDAEIQRVFDSRAWSPVTEFGIERWASPRGLRFQIARPTKFFKTFRGSYHDMMPHHSDAAAAFDLCVQKRCPLLVNGRIWKCGTLALTPGMLERHQWPNLDLWQPYIDPGLDSDCTDQELMQFLQNFGKPHARCRQCPTRQDLDSILDHTKTVTFK